MKNEEKAQQKKNLVKLIELEDTNWRTCFMSGKHRTDEERSAKIG